MISLCHVNVVLVSVQSLEEAIELKNLYRSSFRPEVILYQQNEEKKKKAVHWRRFNMVIFIHLHA